jgi:hypothetical protein
MKILLLSINNFLHGFARWFLTPTFNVFETNLMLVAFVATTDFISFVISCILIGAISALLKIVLKID